ncbi:Nucleoside hydrolase [Giardia duodenalis]|uniref:Nucleoside hydrolase n=1 Tax=Giardia intestinalis TaxID=5741 RepID=V6TCS0_GIAIN|nr:Nucleoside hydrolase [Giardia intestinalis]
MAVTKHVWLDTDCGIDDALALMILGLSTTVQLVGVSCTYGNNKRSAVERNVTRVLNIIRESCRQRGVKFTMPVLCRGPLDSASDLAFLKTGKGERGKSNDENWHGNDGLGDADFSIHMSSEERRIIDTPIPFSDEAPSVLIKRACVTAKQATGKNLSVVAIGPFTSLMSIIHLHAEIDLYIMGAGFYPAFKAYSQNKFTAGKIKQYEDSEMTGLLQGNMPECGMPHAEHNIGCDPVAAQVMFNSFDNIRVVDWTLTLVASVSIAEMDELNSKSLVGRFHRSISKHMEDMTRKHGGDYFALCDPLAAMVCCNEAIIEEEMRGSVEVVLEDTPHFGETVFRKNDKGNTRAIFAVSRDAVMETLRYTLTK